MAGKHIQSQQVECDKDMKQLHYLIFCSHLKTPGLEGKCTCSAYAVEHLFTDPSNDRLLLTTPYQSLQNHLKMSTNSRF